MTKTCPNCRRTCLPPSSICSECGYGFSEGSSAPLCQAILPVTPELRQWVIRLRSILSRGGRLTTAHAPKEITPKVLELAKKVSDLAPVYLPVEPQPGALPGHCFPNVIAHVRRHGGGVRYGHCIWDQPQIALETEFHSVWIRPDGGLQDITPQRDGDKVILFVPDDARTWQGPANPLPPKEYVFHEVPKLSKKVARERKKRERQRRKRGK